jgi:hypothetical protein
VTGGLIERCELQAILNAERGALAVEFSGTDRTRHSANNRPNEVKNLQKRGLR